MVPTESADDEAALHRPLLFNDAAFLEAAGVKAVTAVENTLAENIRELSFMVANFLTICCEARGRCDCENEPSDGV